MSSPEKNVSCVFVRNISFALDKQTVEDAFGEIGPIRNCFLVKEKGQSRHKGIGFVQFAIPEDADRAVAALNKSTLGNRQILVEHAIKRAPLADRKRKRTDGPVEVAPAEPAQHAQVSPPAAGEPKSAKAGQPAKKQRIVSVDRAAAQSTRSGTDKHRLACTVALGNLSSATKDAAIMAARAAGKVVSIVDPAPSARIDAAKVRNDGCVGDVVFCEYDTVKSAMAAVAQLHGLLLSPEVGAGSRPGDAFELNVSNTAMSGQHLWARQVGGEGAHTKACRVIVRNLPFQVTEAIIRAAFLPAGFVWEVTMPRSAEGKPRGFAFVGFTCRADAEKAISLVNGQKLGSRVVAVDWAVAKSFYHPSQVEDDGKQALGDVSMLLPAPGAVTAVHKVVHCSTKLQVPDSGDDEVDAEEDIDIEQHSDDEAPPAFGGLEERAMQLGVLETLVQSKPGVPAAAGLPPPMAKSANARPVKGHADASAQQTSMAQKAAAKAGDGLAKASPSAAPADRPGSGQTYRTVFVRGLPAGTSQQQLHTVMLNFGAVKSCRLVMDQALKKPKGTAFVEFASGTGATKAAAACKRNRDGGGPGVVVNGKHVDVDAALSQQDARAMATQQGIKQGPEDKRRLYLAKEGNIEEGSAAWEDMSAQDQQRRKRGIEDMKMKLRSPNFFVSPLRLSVRNIPMTFSEAKLKQLMIQAVKERAVTERPHLKQVKILREAGKLGKDGKPLSKGLGFVEFTEHEHALCALRQLNNNPHPFGKERRPIVEFAIESVEAIRKREQRQQQHRNSTGDGSPERAARAQARPPRTTDNAGSKQAHHPVREQPEQQANRLQQGRSAGIFRQQPRQEEQSITAGVTTRTRSMLRSPAARKASKPAERRDKLDTLVGVYKKQFMSKPTDRPQLDRRWFD